MRKCIAILLIAAMFIPAISVNVSAEGVHGIVRTRFDDGSYIMERINEDCSRLTGSKTGSKTYSYYGSDGKIKWSADIFGNFVYNGAMSSCTSANVTVTILDDQWLLVSKQATRNGNTAIGEVVMGITQLGVTVGTVKQSLSLSCDKNGNLS